MTKTLTVRGQKFRSASQRRYVVVTCRPADVSDSRWDYRAQAYVPDTLPAFKPTIVRRSDNLKTAKAASDKYGFVKGGWNVVIDTTNGQEVY